MPRPSLDWEQIDGYHTRCSIPGGWLVKAYEDVIHPEARADFGNIRNFDFRIAMCFVPDPTHAWRLDEESG